MPGTVELAPLAPREALAYFRSKGYADALSRFDYRDIWQEEHAEAFVVAKAMRDDVLAAIRQELDDAMAEGRTLAQFQAELAPKLKALGWWGQGIERDPRTGELKEVRLGSMRRLKVIFDTNMRTAYAAGRWARLQRSKDFLPYLEYTQLDRPTKREEHAPFDGIILPIDHPIWAHIFPPNGWFCACDVRPMNDRMLKREGKRLTTEDELAELEISEHRNPRTGQISRLPDGVDPAFGSNPGAVWLDLAARHSETRLDLPDSHAAYDRGWVHAIRELGLRDSDLERVVLYDLDRDASESELGIMTGRADLPVVNIIGAADAAVADPGRRIVAIHNHPSSSPFSALDVNYLLDHPGLAQLVAVGHDGSLYRLGRGAAFARHDVFAFDEWRAAIIEALLDTPGLPDEYGVEFHMLKSHLILMFARQMGYLDYAAAPSGAVSDLFRRHEGVARRLVSDLSEMFS